jgi:hypothetical protein
MALHIKVRRTRPRVYLSEFNLADMRRRIETTHVEEWSQLVVWSRGMAKTPVEYRLREERLSERARRLSFMYAVRPDERLVEMALEIAPALIRLAPSPAGLEALAQLHDSVRGALPVPLAAQIVRVIARGAEGIFRELVKARPVLSEARSRAIAPLLAAGLSLYLEHPDAQEIIGGAVHASRDLVGTLQYYLEKDGGFPLGWAEGLAHLGQVPKLALLAETGLGQTWPRDVPWLVRYTEFLEDGVRSSHEEARKRTDGPYWPGGARTGPVRAELWRILAMVASESGAPSALRLLGKVRFPGHQDERILYEKRPLPVLPEGAGTRARPGRAGTRLYRRAGLALFRGGGEAEAVVRCPGALVAGGERLQAGSFSISCGAELVSGSSHMPSGLVVGGEAGETGPATAAFPRTRHEIGESQYRTSSVIAFESDAGAKAEDGRGHFDWLRVDVTLAYREDAASAVRTFVMMRGPSGPIFVVVDDVHLRREGDSAVSVVSFAAKPEIDGNVVTLERDGITLRDLVLEPDPARMSLEETPAPAGEPGVEPAWRLRVASDERPHARICQAFVVESGPRVDRPDADGSDGAYYLRPACIRLPADDGLAIDAAGRVLVVYCASLPRPSDKALDSTGPCVECVTEDAIDGVTAIGLAPSGMARLQVAGEEPVEAEATDGGSVHFDVRIPARTGFVLTVESDGD